MSHIILLLGLLDKIEWKLKSAMDHYNAALDIAKKANNKFGQGRIYNNIANILELLMDFEQAIEYQKQRLDIATEIEDRDGIVKACSTIAALYHTIGDYESSIE